VGGAGCDWQRYVDSEELRAHPHHSFTLEGDVLMQLADQQLIRVRRKVVFSLSGKRR